MKKWLNDVLKEKIPLIPMKSYQPRSPKENVDEDEIDTEETGEGDEENETKEEL